MSEQQDVLIAKLVKQLHDDNPVSRLNAAGALRLHGERAACAIPELSCLLEDDDQKVRCEAERALRRLRAVA